MVIGRLKNDPLAATIFSESGIFYRHFTESILDGLGYKMGRRDPLMFSACNALKMANLSEKSSRGQSEVSHSLS
jgi:hypothetical protein